MPIHIGSRLRWFTLAGMTIRPRATSSRTSSAPSFSRRATCLICSVIIPERASWIWVRFEIFASRILPFIFFALFHLRLYSCVDRLIDAIVVGLTQPVLRTACIGIEESPHALSLESQPPCYYSVTHGAGHGDAICCGSDGCVEEDCVKSQLRRNRGV